MPEPCLILICQKLGEIFLWEQIIIFKDTKRLLSDRQGLRGRDLLAGRRRDGRIESILI